jgi:hypothetical protein
LRLPQNPKNPALLLGLGLSDRYRTEQEGGKLAFIHLGGLGGLLIVVALAAPFLAVFVPGFRTIFWAAF